MKRLLIYILLFLVLVEGFIYFYGRATVEAIVISQFNSETGLNLIFRDWERRGNTIQVYKPVIFGKKVSEDGSITADVLRIDFDTSEISSRRLTIKQILIDGLQVDSPSEESAFFKLIDAIVKDNPDPFIKSKLISLKGVNFKVSKFRFGETLTTLQPDSIEMNFSDKKKPIVSAESPLEIDLGLPKALVNINQVVGEISVSGLLLSPEITSSLKFKNSDFLQITAGLYHGALTVRPKIQANVEGAGNATATGELQLKNLRLVANDLAISDLPLGVINPAFRNSQSEILAKGELNLLSFNGDLKGSVSIKDIETLPVALKDLKLELAVSNREIKIGEGSFKGDAGAINLAGSYNIPSKKLSAQLITEKLLVKAPDIKVRVPRGIQLSTKLDLTGDLTVPLVSGPLDLEFFKVGVNSEKSTEAIIPSHIDIAINTDELIKSEGLWKIHPLDIETQGRQIRTASLTSIEVKEGELLIPQTDVTIGDRTVKVGGKVSKEGFDIRAIGNADVSSLVGRRDNIEDINGEISLKLDVTGPLDAAQIRGEVNLVDGAFSIPLSGDRFHLEEITGKITFDDRDIRLENFQNTSGDARVTMSGEVSEFLSPQRFGAIKSKFEQVTVQPDPNIILHLHAESELALLSGLPPTLKGAVTVDDALYEQRSNLQELVKKLLGLLVRGAETASRRQISSPILVDVSITSDRSMIVDTDIFQGELSSAINVRGNPNTIRIDGSIYGDSGELTLGRNKFDVSQIKVSFVDQELGSLPKFDLKADGELGPRGSPEQVQLKVSGMLPTPGIVLTSESAKSQKELLAELGLGIDKLSVFSNQSRNTPSIIGALNPFSGAGLKDRVGELTGGASVQVESGYSADTGTFAPRLLLEQPLPFTFRLVAQTDLSQSNRSEVNLEYPLTDQTNVFTGWKNAPTTKNPEASSGSLGVGVHYRERFPGTYVFPGNLLLENLEDTLGIADDESQFDEAPAP